MSEIDPSQRTTPANSDRLIQGKGGVRTIMVMECPSSPLLTATTAEAVMSPVQAALPILDVL